MRIYFRDLPLVNLGTQLSSSSCFDFAGFSFPRRNYSSTLPLRSKASSFSFICCKTNYSTNSSVSDAPQPQPEKIYKNADLDKAQIIQENKGKSGVYRWVNLVNGKSYIGSSVNLALRLRNYFNFSFISNKRRGKSLINEALLKYGYSYFSLEILEFCESSEAILREQYYLDLLKPEYNILKNAGSSLGRKHSEETKARLKGRTLTAEHIAKLKAKTLTTEHIAKIKAWSLSPENKEHLKILNANPEQKAKRLEQLKILNSSKEHHEHLIRLRTIQSQRVQVFDTLNNETTVYPSIREAAKAIGCHKTTIGKAIEHQKQKGASRLIKKRYTVLQL